MSWILKDIFCLSEIRGVKVGISSKGANVSKFTLVGIFMQNEESCETEL